MKRKTARERFYEMRRNYRSVDDYDGVPRFFEGMRKFAPPYTFRPSDFPIQKKWAQMLKVSDWKHEDRREHIRREMKWRYLYV